MIEQKFKIYKACLCLEDSLTCDYRTMEDILKIGFNVYVEAPNIEQAFLFIKAAVDRKYRITKIKEMLKNDCGFLLSRRDYVNFVKKQERS